MTTRAIDRGRFMDLCYQVLLCQESYVRDFHNPESEGADLELSRGCLALALAELQIAVIGSIKGD